ncbi:Gfo/Idh/MocA family protein [Rothia uropygialis]|uniref:Gfo/Idh/MocA family protein n=1 Tax=Kocuria sp. 36 TaxID=1415402 RepID=UPI00101C398D|nr:Gfo/Idh/MocA family oxidoreductase [Kocuria sp. 36]
MTTAAVIGCGDISSIHEQAIKAIEGIELIAVCDVDEAAREAASKVYGVPGFADHRLLLREAEPDVVHICTPHDQHVPVALDCLAAGADVLSEKPVAHTVEQADRLIEAGESFPRQVGVCFQNRYNVTIQEMRRLLDSGDLGEIVGGSATVMWSRSPEYYEAKPWRGTWARSGGGLLINQAIHTIDLLQWLLGDVTEVRGHAATHVLDDVVEVEDTAHMILHHVGGPRSVLYATNTNVTNSPVTLEIVTKNATLSLCGDLTISWNDGRTDVIPERRGPMIGRSYWGVSHLELIRDFYERRGDSQPFWISPREAAKSLRILKEVYSQSFSDA